MRLDDVEVKVNVDSGETSRAVALLDLPGVPPWKIYFVEDVTTGLGMTTPLKEQNLIIRARQKTKGKDDVTVKFRPGRRSQLTNRWLAVTKISDDDLDAEFKVEEDWAGVARTLAISLTSDRPHGLVAAAAQNNDVAALLTQKQKELIDQCAGVPVNLDVLTVLPPVSAMRWPTFSVPGPGHTALSVRAERWTVGDLDFLELSIAVGVAVAEEAQAALETFLKSKGLDPTKGESKTTQVLRLLVSQAAGIARGEVPHDPS